MLVTPNAVCKLLAPISLTKEPLPGVAHQTAWLPLLRCGTGHVTSERRGSVLCLQEHKSVSRTESFVKAADGPTEAPLKAGSGAFKTTALIKLHF